MSGFDDGGKGAFLPALYNTAGQREKLTYQMAKR